MRQCWCSVSIFNHAGGPQGSVLGLFRKLLCDPSLPTAGECPSSFIFSKEIVFAGMSLRCTSAGPERSGVLLNTRPPGAISSLSTGVAETLTAKVETGILPQRWAFTRQHVAFHSIHSSKTWLSLPRFQRSWQSRWVLWGGVKRI